MASRTAVQDRLALALASRAMAKLVRYFAVNPDSAPHVRALERVTGLSPASLTNELERLQSLGLIVREKDGNRVRYHANEPNPLWPQFRALVRQLSTPADVLPYAFGEVDGVEGAFIFGSFAKAREREDSDVDVFILGDRVDESALFRHALEASVLLGREVNAVHATPDEFQSACRSGGFYQNVVREPKQWLVDHSGLRSELELAA